MLDVLAIYEISGKHISRAWFKSGEPVAIDDALQR